MNTTSPNDTAAGSPHSEGSDARHRQLEEFLARLGLPSRPGTIEDLNQAFIHRSYRAESRVEEDNERLELLGDSVIALATTEHLLHLYPDYSEGWLSKLRASVVSRAVLGVVGRDLGIGELLLLGAGEEKSGGRERGSIIGSALEAVFGVLHLHYSWDELREPIRRHVVIPALGLVQREHLVDYKSQLQELTQRDFQTIPTYHVISEGGPDHQKIFGVEVRLEGKIIGIGQGKRKKTAENEAAREALAALEALPPPRDL